MRIYIKRRKSGQNKGKGEGVEQKDRAQECGGLRTNNRL